MRDSGCVRCWKEWRSCAVYAHAHTHTCSEISYRIIDVECISRAKTLQLNLTGTCE